MASLRRSVRLQVKKAEYDEKFIRFAREQRRLKCRKAVCGSSPVRAQNKLEPFPSEDDSPFAARTHRISLALTAGLFSSAKKCSPKSKNGGRNVRQYLAQESAALVSNPFNSSDSSADLVTSQRYSKTLEHFRKTVLNSDDCTVVPTSAGSSPATEKFKTPVVVLEQLPQCCISSSPVRAFGETADLSRLPVPSEISSNDDGLASPDWDTASTFSYHDYNEVCLNKPCADAEPKPYNRETQNDKLTHGPGNGLVFASLEIADNERVDNETLGDMLEVCARMAEIHPEETDWSDNYPSTSATCDDGAGRYNSETCYHPHTNPYPDEPGWQMDETDCAVQSLLEHSFQADQPTLNQGAESANLLSGADTLNKASQELPGKYHSQQSMLQVHSKQDGSGKGNKKKRGRPKKHKTPHKVPSKGVSKKTSQHKVTKKAAGQREMKTEADAKSETVGKPDRPRRDKKASHKYYSCAFCKFRTPDKAEKTAHDKVCHPHRCPFCQRHFFTKENLAVHKAACVLENVQQCKVCDQGYTKIRRKRHFHSRKHAHLVKMVRDVGRALRRGSLESYLASITCDHLSDCQVCHPAWINLDQELEEQPNDDQTEGVKQNPFHCEPPQTKEQGVCKDVSSAVSTGSACENLQGAASLLSEANCFLYTTPPEGCDSHSFQNADTEQEQVYDVFHLDNQSAGSVQEHDLITFCGGDQNTGSLQDSDLIPCHLGGKNTGSRQEHDLATFCSGDQNTGSQQNHDLVPCHLGGKNAGSRQENDLTVFHLDGQNLVPLQESKLTTYDLDEQRSQTMQQQDLTKVYFSDQRTGFLQEPDLAPYYFGNPSAGSAQEHDLTMRCFCNQSTRPVQENDLATCRFGSPDVKSVETPDCTCFSEKQKLQSMQEQDSKCHTRNHSPMNGQQVLIESGPFQGQVITVYNPESQVVAGSQSSVINPTTQEVAMHELQDIRKFEGNSVDFSDMQNRLTVNNHDSANFTAVSKHTCISYSLQNDSLVKLQGGFLNPCFLAEQTDECDCELETQPASSTRDSLADPSSDRQNNSTTIRVDVPDTVLYCGESLTSLLLGQTDEQELGTHPADCSNSSILDTSPDPQRKKTTTSTSTLHATEALSGQEKSVHGCESASQDADTFTDLLELLDECDLSSADLPDGGLDIMEICEDSSSDDGDDTNKAIEQGQDLKELPPVQCAAVKRAAQGEVTEVVDRNLFKDFIQQLTAGEKRLAGGSVCGNQKSADEKLLPAPSRHGSGVGSSGKDATCNKLGTTQSIDKRGYLHCITEGFVKAHENARSRAAAEGKPDGAVNRTKSHDKMVPRQSGKGSLQGDAADVGQDRELLQLCYSAQNIGPQDGTLCTHHLEKESFMDYGKHPESVSASVVTVSGQLASDMNQKTDNIQNQASPIEKTETGICISTDITMNVTKQEVSCADSDTARFSDIMDMVMFDATQKLLDAVSTQTDTSIRCASPAAGIQLVANSSDINIPPRPVPSNETLSWLSESLSPTNNIVSATALSLMTLDANLSEAASGPTSSHVTSTAIIPTVGLMAVNSSEDPATDAGVLSQGRKAVNSSEDPTTDAGVLSQGRKAVNSSEDPATDAGILSQGIMAVNSSEDPATDAGILSQGIMAVNSSEDPTTDAGVLSQGIMAVNSSEDPTTDAGVLSQGRKAVNSSEDPATDAGILSQGIMAVNSSEDPTTDAGVLSQGRKAVNSSEDPATDAGILSQGIMAVNSSEDPTTDAGVLSQGRKAVNSSEDPATDAGILSQGIMAVNSSEDPATDAGILSQGIMAVNSSEGPTTDAGILSQGIKAVNSSEDSTTDAGILSQGIMAVNSSEDQARDAGVLSQGIMAVNSSEGPTTDAGILSQGIKAVNSSEDSTTDAGILSQGIKAVNSSEDQARDAGILSQGIMAVNSSEGPTTDTGILSQGKKAVNSSEDQARDTGILSQEVKAVNSTEDQTTDAGILSQGVKAVNSTEDQTTDAGISSHRIMTVNSPGASTSAVCAMTKSRQVLMRSPDVSQPVSSPTSTRQKEERRVLGMPTKQGASAITQTHNTALSVMQSDEAAKAIVPEESSALKTPADEPMAVVRPRDESPSVVRPIDESPLVVIPIDESPSVVRPRDESPSVVRPRDESPLEVRPRDESPSVVRPRDESMRAADEGTAVVGISDERTCMVMTRNESTAVLGPRDQSTPGVGLAGESSPVVTPRDKSTLDVMPAGVIRLAHGMTQVVRTPDKDTPVFRPVAQVMPEVTETAVKTTATVAPNLEPEARSASAVAPGTPTIPAVQSETRFTSCKPMFRRTPKVGGIPDDSAKNHPKSLNGLKRGKVKSTQPPRYSAVGTPKHTNTPTSKPTALNTPTSKPTTMGTPTSKPTTMGTPTSIPTTMGTPTLRPTTMGTSTSKPTALGTPTSKPTTMGTPTSRPTALGTPTSKPTTMGTPTSNPTTMGTPTSNPTTMGTPTSRPTALGTPTSKPTTMGTPTSNPTTMGTPTSNPTTMGTPTSNPTTMGTPTSNPTTIGTPTSRPTALGTPTSKPTALSAPTSSIVTMGTPTSKPTALGTPTSKSTALSAPTSSIVTMGTPAFKPSVVGTLISNPTTMGIPALKPTANGTPTLKHIALGTPSKPTAVSTSVPGHASISRPTPRHADAKTPSPRPTCVTTPRLRVTGPNTPTPRPSAVRRPICTYRAVNTPMPRNIAMRATPTLGTASTPTSKPIAAGTSTPRYSAKSRPVCTYRPHYTCSAVITPIPTPNAARTPMQGPIVRKSTSRPTAVNSPAQGPTPVNSPTFKPVGVATPTYRPVVKGTVPRRIAPNTKHPRGSTLRTQAPTPQSPSTPSLGPSALNTRAYKLTATSTGMSGTSTRGIPLRSTIAGAHFSATFPVGTPIPGPCVVNTSTSSLQAGNTNIALARITPSSASGCGMKGTKDNWQHCSGQAESQDSKQLSDYTPIIGSLAGFGMTTKGSARRLKFGEGLISTCRQDTQRCGQSSRKRFFCNQESTGMENCDHKAARSSYSHRVAIGMDVQAKSTLCEKTTMSCGSRKRSTHLSGCDSAARSTSKASLANISNDNGCTALLTGVFPTTSSCGRLCAHTEPTLMPSSTTMRYVSEKEEHLSHTRRSTILAPRNQQHTVPELDRFCPASATVKRHRQEIVTNAHIKRKCNRKNPLFPFAQASQPKKAKLCECERDTHEGRSRSQPCNRPVRGQVMQSRDDANIPTLQKAKDSQLSVAPYQHCPGVRANTCDPADLQVAHNTFFDDNKSAVGSSVKEFNWSQENVGPAEREVSYDTSSYLISGNGTVIPGNISLSRYDGRLPTVYVSHSMLPDSPLLQSISTQQYFRHELQYLTSPVSADTDTASPFMQAVAFSRAGMSNPFVSVPVAATTSMEDRDSLLHRPGLNSSGSSEALMPALLANSFHQGMDSSLTSQMENAAARKIEHQIVLLHDPA